MHVLISASAKRKSVEVAKHKRKKPSPKTGWNRSKLLKLIMPLLSGGNGEDLIAGLNDNDAEKVKHVMHRITDSVVASVKSKD
jgi:hypothetical protein